MRITPKKFLGACTKIWERKLIVVEFVFLYLNYRYIISLINSVVFIFAYLEIKIRLFYWNVITEIDYFSVDNRLFCNYCFSIEYLARGSNNLALICILIISIFDIYQLRSIGEFMVIIHKNLKNLLSGDFLRYVIEILFSYLNKWSKMLMILLIMFI